MAANTADSPITAKRQHMVSANEDPQRASRRVNRDAWMLRATVAIHKWGGFEKCIRTTAGSLN